MGPAGWIFMGLFWLILLGLAVWAVVALASGQRPSGRGRMETPREILDRRLAQGELTVEQYRQFRAELAGRPPETTKQ